jgi:hypothetical protein
VETRFREPKLRDEFRRDLRARLMTEAVTALTPRRRETAWTFLRPALAISVATVVLVGGAGAAAAGSLPGDPAFVLKRAAEDVQVALTFDEVARVQLLAQIADRRVQELQKVADTPPQENVPTAAEEVAQAVARFRAAVDAVQQAAPAEKSDAVQDLVDAAREKHEAVLDRVQQRIENEKARQAIERAKDEEDRDTHDEKDKRAKNPSSTPRPARTSRPAETARPGESSRPQVTPRVRSSG